MTPDRGVGSAAPIRHAGGLPPPDPPRSGGPAPIPPGIFPPRRSPDRVLAVSGAPSEAPKARRTGQRVFALCWLALAAWLLLRLGDQTRWVDTTDLVAQPRFWPAVALTMMTVFGALHLWHLPRRLRWRSEWAEARRWLEPLEYALWFMVFVWIVPVIGFLPATVVFAPSLVWRLGYRRGIFYVAAVIFAVLVVIVFKGFLAVRIPGGAVYEFLPGAMRSFAILWL